MSSISFALNVFHKEQVLTKTRTDLSVTSRHSKLLCIRGVLKVSYLAGQLRPADGSKNHKNDLFHNGTPKISYFVSPQVDARQ